jgi:ABC-type Fe2+-enterobactin transport system substrate-binding protein
LSISSLMQELQRLVSLSEKGTSAIYDAEVKLAEAENALDLTENRAFIKASGSVAERTALAKLESAQARLDRDIAKAELNRVRVKIKSVEQAIMATQTMSKLTELEARL